MKIIIEWAAENYQQDCYQMAKNDPPYLIEDWICLQRILPYFCALKNILLSYWLDIHIYMYIIDWYINNMHAIIKYMKYKWFI